MLKAIRDATHKHVRNFRDISRHPRRFSIVITVTDSSQTSWRIPDRP
jgi:hypothetical protein